MRNLLENFRLDALDLEDLDDGAREAAHGHLWRALHEHDERVCLDCSIDLGPRIRAKAPRHHARRHTGPQERVGSLNHNHNQATRVSFIPIAK